MINLILTIIVLVLVVYLASRIFKTLFKVIGFVIFIVFIVVLVSGYMVHSDYNVIKDNINADKYFVLYDSDTESYLSAFKMTKEIGSTDMFIVRNEIDELVSQAKDKELAGLLFVIDKEWLLKKDVPNELSVAGIKIASLEYAEYLSSESEVISTTTFMYLVENGVEVNSKGFIYDILRDRVELYPRLKSIKMFNILGVMK